ncbi:MAG: suppressor of fused domain protein [Defluviitaleaceae bacterium]|nr:suppressor of fused domain protein [Defluviitaleaceae bacterium]
MNNNENERFRENGDELTPGGSRVYRHDDVERDFKPPEQYCVYIDEVCGHFDAMFPNRETIVLHEIISDLVHIDVHVMKPAQDGDFYVLYTTGMSDLPMNIHPDVENPELWRHAEVFMLLPPTWKLPSDMELTSNMPSDDYWAIGMLKFLARMPHEFNTWLGDGHTVPNGPHYTPILPNSKMGGVVLVGIGEENGVVKGKDGNEINIYMVALVSEAETNFKLERGMDALMSLFDQHKIDMVQDVWRGSCV